jgi:hypothetical protein
MDFFEEIQPCALTCLLDVINSYFLPFFLLQDLIRFYQDQSIVLWNGNPLKGVPVLTEWFKSLPSSEHTIESLDCHPIPACMFTPFLVHHNPLHVHRTIPISCRNTHATLYPLTHPRSVAITHSPLSQHFYTFAFPLQYSTSQNSYVIAAGNLTTILVSVNGKVSYPPQHTSILPSLHFCVDTPHPPHCVHLSFII